jgi:hypothetical protein
VPIKAAGPERSKKAPILIGSSAVASSTAYPNEKATMIAKSKTIIFLVMFILKSPLSQIVVLRAEIAVPGQFSITSFYYFSLLNFSKHGK